MYSLSNNMQRQYTINVLAGADKKNNQPITKKYRVLPGAAGEILIQDEEAAEIKKIGGPVATLLKEKKLELTKVSAKGKPSTKKEDADDSIAS